MNPKDLFSKEVIQRIAPLNVIDLVKIKESEFRQVWLSFFCGEAPRDKINNYLSAWRALTGSLGVGAELVDEQGNKILDIPPLRRHEVDFSKCDARPGNTYGNIFYHYSLMQANSPMMANVQLNRMLAKKANQEPKPVLVYDEEQWKTLFSHFGRSDLLQKMSGAVANSAPSLDDEVFVCD